LLIAEDGLPFAITKIQGRTPIKEEEGGTRHVQRKSDTSRREGKTGG
jgi:hypothetical protein